MIQTQVLLHRELCSFQYLTLSAHSRHSVLASPGRRLLQAVFYAPRYRGIALREEINDLPQVRLSARTELCFLPNKVTSWDCLQIFEILCPF